ncbi:MAG: CoA pyrophosphatase [Gemmatimonadetes bacterium]|nr:CoA pyrophosphatase [Gemmatimonadota bacterium]
MSLAWERLARRLAAREPKTFDLAGLPPDHAYRWAAVAVILCPDPDAVLRIRRAERAGDPWSGHIGLPGGRRDPSDPDLCTTALRETAEEIGCTLSRDGLLGQLDDVWPRTPLPQVIVVRPFVFALTQRPRVTLNPEVADTFWVPLTELQDPATYRDTPLQVRGREMIFPAYHLGPGIVWGLTERILTPMVALAMDGPPA